MCEPCSTRGEGAVRRMSAPEVGWGKTMRGVEYPKAPRPQATKQSFEQDVDQMCDDKR